MIKTRNLVLVWLATIFTFTTAAQKNTVQFHYLGHSSFVITFDDNLHILTDYGKPNAWLEYGWDSPIHDIGDLVPDLVTYSHQHDDHYDPKRLDGLETDIFHGGTEIYFKGDLSVETILTSEKHAGANDNHSYLFIKGNLKILHLGDCQGDIMNIDSVGHRNKLIGIIPSGCDVMILPIESQHKFIEEAEIFIQEFKPKVVIPSHYWSQEYKDAFFDYINNQIVKSKIKYEVVKRDGSVYNFERGKPDVIYVIDLKPSPYNK